MTVAELEQRLGNSYEMAEWAAYFKILKEQREKARAEDERRARQRNRTPFRR